MPLESPMVVLFTSLAVAAPLHRVLDEVLAAPAYDGATATALVVDLGSGEVVYSRDPDRRVLPASVVKWLTAVAAADQLGLDYTFETQILATGAVSDGVLAGDLVVRGSGDPSLGGDDPAGLLRAWAKELAGAGITRVSGDLVADPTALGDPPLGAGWAWDDTPYGFSAPLAGLNLGHNVMEISVRATTAGEPVTVEPGVWEPCADDLAIAARTGDGTKVRVQPDPFGPTALVGGLMPGARQRLRLPVPRPPSCLARMWKAVLAEEGVQVDGVARVGRAPVTARVLAVHRSAPLLDLLRVMLEDSQNLYAEAVARALDPAEVRTWKGASASLDRLLTSAGVPAGAAAVRDGSGLSRYDLVTARSLVAVTLYASRQPWFDTLVQCLPVAGRTGTLSRRLAGTLAEGRVRAKTGSMTGVRNLVGLVEDAGGRTLAVALLVDGFVVPQGQAIGVQDRALTVIAASARGRISRRNPALAE
jgi:D-alanyl-D-alanine carboxypeptidase/D-alanyl-D-alanine-endopeptidase (penicillin-binding protein 4)